MAVDEKELREAVALLDRLLGVDARKPGKAADLPAVIRVIESLEPAGGMGFPVFPASYAGARDSDPPVYDLNGIEYGQELESVTLKDRVRKRHQVMRARQCTLDSPQSQANRTEIAFLEDEQLSPLVPRAAAKIPRADGRKDTEDILCLPHRVADFRVRLSKKADDVKAAISSFAAGDCLPLLRLMPTSVVFGFWDSRGEGYQHKHARLLLSRIDAFDVVPFTKHALYSGPYSKDEFAELVLVDSDLAAATQEEVNPDGDEKKTSRSKAAFKKMAERGFTAAPSEGLGGVLVLGKIERLALISLTDIARLSCADKDSGKQKILTNAARRYIFALAALAEGFPRSTGSHRLRSGCELLSTGDGPVIELRGRNAEKHKEMSGLYLNRALLIAVANGAKEILGIQSKLDDFVVDKDSLKADFDGTGSGASKRRGRKK